MRDTKDKSCWACMLIPKSLLPLFWIYATSGLNARVVKNPAKPENVLTSATAPVFWLSST